MNALLPRGKYFTLVNFLPEKIFSPTDADTRWWPRPSALPCAMGRPARRTSASPTDGYKRQAMKGLHDAPEHYRQKSDRQLKGCELVIVIKGAYK